MKLSVALFFAATVVVSAQSIEVPRKLRFADMTLTIRDDARREIQKDVDAFTRYPKSFNAKVERARTYFPIIEKILAEEKVPDDFKFLVIQESALIADAVSTSNAVGYWQFKDFTAIEMGLRVDRQVDERMNIFASTRAAARYIKKNNTFFNNWLFALQAYQMGAGGVLRSEKDSKSGRKDMDITGSTYWYVKKYLAHKIAYEGFTHGTPELQIIPYETANGKRTLSDIARELNVEEEQVKAYNKWLKTQKIPDDRNYAVMIPIKGDPSGLKLPEAAVASTTVGLHENSTKAPTVANVQERTKVNGISAIRAGSESPTTLAERAGVDLSSFLKWNDISISDKLVPGNYYLLGKKRNRAESAYHKVQPGESLWDVSQRYGVRMKRLRRYNRLDTDNIKPGTTLWLASRKPREGSGDPVPEKAVEVDRGETFAWEVTPAESQNAQPATEGDRKEVRIEVSQAVEPGKTEVQADSSDSVANSADTLATPLEASTVSSPARVDVVTIPSDSVAIGTPINQVRPAVGEHVVQPKETLYAIARQHSVGVMDLVDWNNLNLQDGIKPGQVIRLTPPEGEVKPSATEEQASAVVLIHEVKATDTLYSIARKYGVTIKDVMEWNNKKDFSLAVGEKLRIEKK